jgi:hypothetical protein
MKTFLSYISEGGEPDRQRLIADAKKAIASAGRILPRLRTKLKVLQRGELSGEGDEPSLSLTAMSDRIADIEWNFVTIQKLVAGGPQSRTDWWEALRQATAKLNSSLRNRGKSSTRMEQVSEAPVSYTAVMLDQRSHDLLMSRMRPHMPEGWKVYAHHMTMHMGAAKPEDKVGQSVTIVADAWAADERTVAVRVTGHPSRNRTPHVTVAVNAAAGAKPKDSNLHTEWKPMPPLRLTGTVGEA